MQLLVSGYSIDAPAWTHLNRSLSNYFFWLDAELEKEQDLF